MMVLLDYLYNIAHGSTAVKEKVVKEMSGLLQIKIAYAIRDSEATVPIQLNIKILFSAASM